MKGFAAGFATVWVLILAAHALPKTAPVKPSASRTFVAQPAPIEKPVAETIDVAQPCRDLFNVLLSERPLNFDHRSEQVKAEAMYILDATVEALSLCPGLGVAIEWHHGGEPERYQAKLAERRAIFLATYWEQRGLESLVIEKNQAENAARDGPATNISLRTVRLASSKVDDDAILHHETN